MTDQVWVPHLTPAPGNVIGDWVFRCPAIVHGDQAWVVDLEDIAASKERHWLDWDYATRTVTLATGDYRHDGHVFFVREGDARPASDIRLHEVDGHGVARWCWQRWGRRRPKTPIDAYAKHILRWAFDSEWSESVWQDDIGAPVFIVDVNRHPSVPKEKRTWREPRSVWNQAWFSTQRCANGLFRWARRTKDAALEARARRMTEVALSAPRDSRGLFPSVMIADETTNTWRWTNSDRRPADASAEACHVVDAAFTCRQLLEWHSLSGDTRALDYARAFGETLVRLQRPSGAFPGWIEPDGRVVETLAEGPESAVAATLLFELGENEAAMRCLPFLEACARDGRWEDFETYFSCSRWGTPGERVARNGVYKQNTLSIAWTAEAFLRAKKLDLARRCIDELSLYQALWDPPFLPAPSFGGFGVMNGDAEWNDARQSLFAPLYLELGRATNDDELVERGLWALHASFAMLYCPENEALARAYERRHPFFGPESYGFMMENQGHDPAQPIGTFTIFTWGNGSALATAARVRDEFPELAP